MSDESKADKSSKKANYTDLKSLLNDNNDKLLSTTQITLNRLSQSSNAYSGRRHKNDLSHFSGLINGLKPDSDALLKMKKMIECVYIFDFESALTHANFIHSKEAHTLRILIVSGTKVFIEINHEQVNHAQHLLHLSGLSKQEIKALEFITPPVLCTLRDAMMLENIKADAFLYVASNPDQDALIALDEVSGKHALTPDPDYSYLDYVVAHALLKLYKRQPKLFKPSRRKAIDDLITNILLDTDGDPFLIHEYYEGNNDIPCYTSKESDLLKLLAEALLEALISDTARSIPQALRKPDMIEPIEKPLSSIVNQLDAELPNEGSNHTLGSDAISAFALAEAIESSYETDDALPVSENIKQEPSASIVTDPEPELESVLALFDEVLALGEKLSSIQMKDPPKSENDDEKHSERDKPKPIVSYSISIKH